MKPIYLKNNKTSECIKLVLRDNISEQDMDYCLDMFPVDLYTSIPQQSFETDYPISQFGIGSPVSKREIATVTVQNRTDDLWRNILVIAESEPITPNQSDVFRLFFKGKFYLSTNIEDLSPSDFINRMEADLELQQHIRLTRLELNLIKATFLTRWYWKREIKKVKKELNMD